ncbi:MAG TPA: hypothetical protein VNE39_15475 [Planctomycetota bacterium]|nr:hypothetical protein [Planctomycetota bacterium]
MRQRLLATLAAAALAAQGCTYLRNRGRDAAEMFDLGLTFSKKPQFGLYMNCPVILPIGFGKVDGYYAGVGRGKVGVMEHHQRNAGALVWGYERNTWQGPAKAGEKAGDKAVEDQPVGLLAIARGERGKQPYRVSCKHYFHLGWVGITANICWLEIPDFFLGWFLIDLSGDDVKGGTAPNEPPRPAAPEAEQKGPR